MRYAGPIAAVLAAASLACGPGNEVVDQVPLAVGWGLPESGRAPMTVRFSGEARGGDAPFTYRWEFGDGTGGSDDPSPVHTYDLPGTFRAGFRVTDADGDFDETEAVITVEPGILGATVDASPLAGTAPLLVAFTAVVAGGQPPYQHAWDFGDGGTSTEERPSHTFTTAGDYDVLYTATDQRSGSASAGIRVSVSDVPVPLAVSVTATPASGSAPLGVAFQATVTGGRPPYSFAWVFGDGASSTVEDPGHTYTGAGSFEARITVGDSAGDSASAGATVTVTAPLVVVINELRYDTTGGIDTNCFIELVGPPLTRLTGFTLVAVAGETGAAYDALSLDPYTIPGDGIFVLAQPTADAPTLAASDVRTEFANLENGPDSLRLEKGGVAVDAVGYGSFGGAIFAGEGRPAPGVQPEHSLGRDAASTDTDDNAADFSDFAGPTPGAPNG